MKLVKECVDEVAYLIMELWSDNSLNEAVDILIEYLDNDEAGVFVKEVDSHYVGLAMCSLRHDYVEGCETSPVGYLEGIVVDEAYRNKGIATELCKECEEWAKMAGCSDVAPLSA